MYCVGFAENDLFSGLASFAYNRRCLTSTRLFLRYKVCSFSDSSYETTADIKIIVSEITVKLRDFCIAHSICLVFYI